MITCLQLACTSFVCSHYIFEWNIKPAVYYILEVLNIHIVLSNHVWILEMFCSWILLCLSLNMQALQFFAACCFYLAYWLLRSVLFSLFVLVIPISHPLPFLTDNLDNFKCWVPITSLEGYHIFISYCFLYTSLMSLFLLIFIISGALGFNNSLSCFTSRSYKLPFPRGWWDKSR